MHRISFTSLRNLARLAAVTALSISSLFSVGANPAKQPEGPDFNFPKTVASNADATYQKALVSGDSIALLQSLIDYVTAEELITRDNTQKCLDRLAQAENRAKGPCTRALIDLLRANVFYEFYRTDRWTFNERELPLRPVPADISLWSGEQLTDTISALAHDALKYAPALKATPITAFGNVIKADRNTQIYYPTLYDFAVNRIVEFDNKTDETRIENLYKELTASHKPGSAPYIMNILKYNNQGEDSLLTLYNQFKDSEYSADILLKIGVRMDDFTQNKKLVRAIRDYLDNHPSSIAKNKLQNKLNLCMTKIVDIEYESVLLPPATPVDLSIKLTNTTTATLSLYYVGSLESTSSFDIQTLLKDKPIRNFNIESDSEIYDKDLPFSIKLKTSIIIPKEGRYVLAVTSPTSATANIPGFIEITSSTTFGYMVKESRSGSNYAICVNPFSGKPITADVSLTAERWVKNNQELSTAELGKTDVNGMLKFKYPYKESLRSTLLFTNGDQRYRSMYAWPAAEPQHKASVEEISAYGYTSLAIYHPDDSVEFAFIVGRTRDDSCKPASDIELDIIMYDTNHQAIDTLRLTSDKMGRVYGKMHIPDGMLTGRYKLTANMAYNTKSSNHISQSDVFFTVSDYKMPQYEAKITAIRYNSPSNGCLTIEGEALTYSKFPIARANVEVQLTGYDAWGFNRLTEDIIETTTTDENGHFSIVFDEESFDYNDNPENTLFYVNVDVVSGTGERRHATRAFSLGKPYTVIMGDIHHEINIAKPLEIPVEVLNEKFEHVKSMDMIFQISANEEVVSIGKFQLDKPIIDLSTIPQGEYKLCISTADTTLSNHACTDVILYNPSAKTVPVTSPMWIPSYENKFDEHGIANILVGVSDSTSYIYTFVVDSDGNHYAHLHKAHEGYNNISIKIPSLKAEKANVTMLCMRNAHFSDEVLTISNPAANEKITLEIESFRNKLTPGNNEIWKFRTLDSHGNPTRSAILLDVYNKALDIIKSHRLYRPIFRNTSFNCGRFTPLCNYINDIDIKYQIPYIKLPTKTINAPIFNDFGYSFGFNAPRNLKTSILRKSAAGFEESADMVVETAYAFPYNNAATAIPGELVAEYGEEDVYTFAMGKSGKSDYSYKYRPAEMPLMMFMPMLETGEDGVSEVGFVVPDANASWILNAIAYNDKMDSADLMREFTTSKPVMVAANAPRFLREGDRACVLSSVMNATDSAVTVEVKTECFDPISGRVLSRNIQTVELAASASTEVVQSVEAPADLSAIGFRVYASNGRFTDGEQILIAINPAAEPVVESKPFYLAPGTTDYSLTVPELPADATVTLSYCDNPRWYIVSALPSLRESAGNDVFSAAAALYSVYLTEGLIKEFPQVEEAIEQWRKNPADSALVSMLEKNSELKTALLKATPWMQQAASDTERMQRLAILLDRKELSATADKAIAALEKMQANQGGWMWFPQAREASVWATSTVLQMFGYVRYLGYMPKNSRVEKMMTQALLWLDTEQAKNYRKPKTPRPAEYMSYVVLRQDFADIPMNSATSKLVGDVVQYVVAKWRKMDLAQKPQAALILYRGGYKTLSGKLLESMEQFSTSTPEKGLWFPSFDDFKPWSAMSKLATTAYALEAFTLIEPQKKVAQQLAQWLVLQKETLNWGNSISTSYVIASLLKAPGMQLAPAGKTTFTLADSILTPASIESLTGSFTMPLTACSPSGKTLTLHRTGNDSTQAFGSLLMRYQAHPADIKAASVDGLTIEKRTLKRVATPTGFDWIETDSLHTGDYVRTLLTIVTDRDLEYVVINDNRMAALEPVDQLPGYIYTEGVSLYRENRDEVTNFFVTYLPKGSYQLSYESTVNNSGTFASGIATIQSQYAPAMTAHSAGKAFEISR